MASRHRIGTLLALVGIVVAAVVVVRAARTSAGPMARGDDRAPNADVDAAGPEARAVDPAPPWELAERFVSVDVDAPGSAHIDGTVISLQLVDGRVSANLGCNTLGATAGIVDGVLTVGAVSATRRGCDPARHAQDEWFAELLASSPTLIAESTSRFRLTAGATSIVFVAEP